MTRPAAGPDPTEARSDGCTRDRAALLAREAPNWVYVGRNPTPRWATGVANTQFEPELAAHPATSDLPFTHDSYDVLYNLRPDPASQGLLGGDPAAKTGNYAGKDEETARLHSEWEENAFPPFAWPERGDRITVLGSWVWDCDHWEPGGEHTEFHPLRAIWVRRAPGRASLRSPFGEAEADLVISTDKTPAGAQADCALPRLDPLSFRACLDADTGWQDVTGSYSFVLRAPPRPKAAERLVARARDRGSTPGAPPLRLELATDSVTASVDVKSAPGQRIVIAKQIFLGWRPAARPIHVRVTLDRLLVRRAMDPPLPRESTRRDQTTLAPGEWNVYWQVGGTWGTWSPRLLRPRDGRSFAFGRAVDLYVGPHTPWRVAVYARECDLGGFGSTRGQVALTPCPLDHEFASGDDNPGVARQSFIGTRRAVGRHRVDAQLDGSTCPRANKHGCYQLAYHVRVIPRRR